MFASVGVHPDYEDTEEPSVEQLVSPGEPSQSGRHRRNRARLFPSPVATWNGSAQRFRTHIRAAIAVGKPLIIHTRAAAADTLCILREEGAERVGGVMHCFTETEEVADQAMALNFYISFSGIVTFKKALELKAVARHVPLERMLIETDSPYLAPVPYRGRTNEPAYVRHVAEEIAALRGIAVEEVGAATTRNFFELFQAAQPWR